MIPSFGVLDTMRQVNNYVIAGLSLAAVVGMFSGSTEPVVSFLKGSAVEPTLIALHNGNSIIFNISVGFLASVMFWMLNVYVPERRVRSVLRENLAKQYQYFKGDVVSIMLGAGGSYPGELPKTLTKHQAFRAYYRGENMQRWYDVLNYLQANPERLSDIVAHMQLLSNEVEYLLHKVSIHDPEVHAFLKRLSLHTFRLQRLSVYSYDEVKYLGAYLFEVLAAWNVITGFLTQDPIESMIEKI